jgi:hypothetical protein
MLTSDFGASIADSMATAYGCDGTSSGLMSTGVWQFRTKSRDTVKTKSASVRNIVPARLRCAETRLDCRWRLAYRPTRER